MNNSNKKNTIFVEANIMKISTKFQIHPPYDFLWRSFNNFLQINLLVANQIQRHRHMGKVKVGLYFYLITDI